MALGHADKRFVPHGKGRRCEDFKSLFTAVHHRITRIPLHLMPGEAQLIHIAEREKDVFVAVLALQGLGVPS